MKQIAILLGLCLMTPRDVWACGVCFGDPNSPQTEGMNYAIMLMLIVTGCVLGGFITAIIVFCQRGKQMK